MQVEAGIPLQICLSRFNRWLQNLQLNMGVVFSNIQQKPSAMTASQKLCTFLTWSGKSYIPSIQNSYVTLHLSDNHCECLCLRWWSYSCMPSTLKINYNIILIFRHYKSCTEILMCLAWSPQKHGLFTSGTLSWNTSFILMCLPLPCVSDWDLGVCLQYECKRKQLHKPDVLNSWIDLRSTYRVSGS